MAAVMTTTTTDATDGPAATRGWLSAVVSRAIEFIWPMCLTLVVALGAWVLVPMVLLGWQPVGIISGSMAPAVQPGHVVVVEPYGGQDLGVGTVVTYRDAAGDRLVTHRISAVEPDGTIRTRGDGNRVDDPVPLTKDRIVGVGRLVVPAAGLPALWAQEGRTELLAMAGALTVLTTGAAASAAATGVRTVRQRLSLRGGGRRSRVRRLGVALGVVTVLAAVGTIAVSGAAFVGSRANAANGFRAGVVAPPLDVMASGTCPAPGGAGKGAKPAIELSWSPVPGATAYEVQRGTDAGGPFTPVGTVTDSCYHDADVNASTTYHYQVRSVAEPWRSAWSATVSGRPVGRGA